MVRPKAEDMTFTDWKAVTAIWRTEYWDMKIRCWWWLYEMNTEWTKRVRLWK